MSRPIGIALIFACLVPSVALADCQDRIAAVEKHPALAQQGDAAGPGASQPAAPSHQDPDVVWEGGGKTEHADGGPATPSESWFTNSRDDDKATVLTHLDAAKAARQSGDETGCLDAVEQAEAALENG